MSPVQRLELLLFVSCFFAFAYFNQGGGWNQNARFAEVRALAEQGRFAINDYIVYKRPPGSDDLVRYPVTRAEYTENGQRFRLSWVDMEWNLYPIGEKEFPLEPGVKKAPMVSDCSSGDIGYVPATGHFHPNKPPGTSLLAVPAYFIIYHVEKMLGINPDRWWVLDVNTWLTSACSVGLIAALGCVFFFRLARELAGGAVLPALLATLAFAFGTTFFPFSTLLFDHSLTASFLIMALYFLRRSAPDAWAWRSVLAGLCAGFAVLTNWVAAGAVIALGFYALLAGTRGRGPGWRRTFAYIAGGIGPAIVMFVCSYLCYGSLRPGTDFQSPLFQDEGAFLGMFLLPTSMERVWYNFFVLKAITFSPFRGVFWFAPVLLLGVVGLAVWFRQRRWATASVCLAIFGWFFLVNLFFNGYHAGFSAGPRYMIPGMPFLALPLVVAFARWPRITGFAAVLSIAINLLLTVTDAQNPVGVGGHARIEGRRDQLSYNLIGEYAWPLFWQGNAAPLLEEQLAVEMEKARVRIGQANEDPDERAREIEAYRQELRQAIERGEPSPFMLASIRGPVSVNPLASYEGLFEYRHFPPGSPPTKWASFNVGEFFFPESRWSVLPLLVVSGGCAALAIVLARRRVLA